MARDDARDFVTKIHRTHKAPVGHKFSLAVVDEEGNIRGVAMVGRPVARGLDDGLTLEVTRLATDECVNACSCLYSAAWRAAKALGYREICTYTRKSECGASLRAAGWVVVATVRGRSWDCPSRPRSDTEHTEDKLRWQPKG